MKVTNFLSMFILFIASIINFINFNNNHNIIWFVIGIASALLFCYFVSKKND